MILGLSLAVVCVILGLIEKYWNDIDREQLKNFVLTELKVFSLFIHNYVCKVITLCPFGGFKLSSQAKEAKFLTMKEIGLHS